MNLSDFSNFIFKSKFADIVALDTGDFSKLEIKLDEQTQQKINDNRNNLTSGRNILVLGGNGFVGVHLINRLLQDERVQRVYTIVRSSNSMSSRERIQTMMSAYALSLERIQNSKLQCLEGTITQERFGLTQTQYTRLSFEVDTVFQCASSTDYSLSYLDLRSNWVLGLLQVVQFCIDGKIKQLTYLGSVIAHLYQDSQDFLRPDSWWFSGYAQMKWVNQKMLASLISNGLPITVCEAPYILGSTSIGKDPGLHYSFWRLLRTAKNLEIIWDGNGVDFVPVDILTNTLVENAFSLEPLPLIRPCYPTRYSNKILAILLGCQLVSWEKFYTNICNIPQKSIRRMICVDAPKLIEKTRKIPIYEPEFQPNAFPSVEHLMTLYCEQAPINDLHKTSKRISVCA